MGRRNLKLRKIKIGGVEKNLLVSLNLEPSVPVGVGSQLLEPLGLGGLDCVRAH